MSTILSDLSNLKTNRLVISIWFIFSMFGYGSLLFYLLNQKLFMELDLMKLLLLVTGFMTPIMIIAMVSGYLVQFVTNSQKSRGKKEMVRNSVLYANQSISIIVAVLVVLHYFERELTVESTIFITGFTLILSAFLMFLLGLKNIRKEFKKEAKNKQE